MSHAFEVTPAFVYDVGLQRTAIVAGYTLLVYDYFLTLSDEVEYIWNAPWTPVKFIYLANRYIVLLGQTIICIQATGFVATFTGGCEFYAVFLAVYILLSLETAHVLVGLRAWAIWGGDRSVLWSVVVAYVASLVSIVVAVSQGEDFSNFEPTVTSLCYRPIPVRAWLFYLASLAVDLLLFCMTMMGLWSYCKALKDGSLELIRMLMRSVTVFYVVNVCYDVLGIVSWTRYRNSPKSFAITAFFIPVLAICGQRVVHDLRRTAPMSYSGQDLSQMVDRQVKALTFWPASADEAVSVDLEGIPRGSSSSIDEIGTASDDYAGLRLEDDAGISIKTPSFKSRSYSLATSLGTSVSVKTG